MWHLYIVECSDGTLYTGITTNVEMRVDKHNAAQGAKYTRGRGPVKLVYSREVGDKAAASKEEYRIKKLTREEKMNLLV